MGDDDAHWDDQKPAHNVYVVAFYIDRYPVTNAEYKRFVDATGHRAPRHILRGQVPLDRGDHPVTNLSWEDARGYAHWTGKRLPTEAEWEKAASWDPIKQIKTNYPWGDAWDATRCNTVGEGGPGNTMPVGAHSPRGDSSYGVADMIGNVWEWCSSASAPYPYQPNNGCEDPLVESWRILRGAAWDTVLKRDACCSFRHAFPCRFFLPSFGCRCVVSVSDACGIVIGGE